VLTFGAIRLTSEPRLVTKGEVPAFRLVTILRRHGRPFVILEKVSVTIEVVRWKLLQTSVTIGVGRTRHRKRSEPQNGQVGGTGWNRPQPVPSCLGFFAEVRIYQERLPTLTAKAKLDPCDPRPTGARSDGQPRAADTLAEPWPTYRPPCVAKGLC